MSDSNAPNDITNGDRIPEQAGLDYVAPEPSRLNLVELSAQTQVSRGSPFLTGAGSTSVRAAEQLPDQNTHLSRVAQEIQTRFSETRNRFNQEVNSQGVLLGRPLNAVKNALGTEFSSYTINRRFDEERIKVDRLQTLAQQGNTEEFRQVYRSLTGMELDPPNNQSITRRLSIESLIGDYDRSQRSWVNTAALTIPFMLTGFRGAPLVLRSEQPALQALAAIGRSTPLAMAHDAAIVSAGNVALKAMDGRYSDPGYDAITGAVTGALWAPAQRASTMLTERYIARNGSALGITPIYQGPLSTTFSVNNRGVGMYMTESFLRHGSTWSAFGAYEPVFREATDLAFGRNQSYDLGRVATNSLYGLTSGLMLGQGYGMTYTPAFNRIFMPLYTRFVP